MEMLGCRAGCAAHDLMHGARSVRVVSGILGKVGVRLGLSGEGRVFGGMQK